MMQPFLCFILYSECIIVLHRLNFSYMNSILYKSFKYLCNKGKLNNTENYVERKQQ